MRLPHIQQRRAGGFTAIELVVVVSISVLVFAGMMSAFVWSMRTAEQCRQYAASQTSALKSYERLVSYMRNGVMVTNIDVNGDWVNVVMDTTGTVARFAYDSTGAQLTFRANLVNSNVAAQVLATGVSKVTTTPLRDVFIQTGPNSLRVAYRVSKSLSGNYPAEVDVGVRMRNY